MFRVVFDECALVILLCSAPLGPTQRPAFGILDSYYMGSLPSGVCCIRCTFFSRSLAVSGLKNTNRFTYVSQMFSTLFIRCDQRNYILSARFDTTWNGNYKICKLQFILSVALHSKEINRYIINYQNISCLKICNT